MGARIPHGNGTFCAGYAWTCLGAWTPTEMALFVLDILGHTRGAEPPHIWHFLCWIYLDMLGGSGPPPRNWHFLCWIYLDTLGGSGPPRKWHFLCWMYLDVLGGQDPPREGHYLWGYTWTCLGLPAVDVLSVTRKGQQRCGLSLPILQPLVSVFGDRHFSVFFSGGRCAAAKALQGRLREVYNQ